jgi:hypothetical protein
VLAALFRIVSVDAGVGFVVPALAAPGLIGNSGEGIPSIPVGFDVSQETGVESEGVGAVESVGCVLPFASTKNGFAEVKAPMLKVDIFSSQNFA